MDKDIKKLIAAARGEIKADLVLKNARIVNVFSKELEEGDVAICGGFIAGIGSYEGDEEIDLQGGILCPGLVDGHIHIESSMVSPAEFAKAVIPHGTTTVVTDPHEIANVAGKDGISFMMDSSRGLPLDIFFMLPSCVPATPLDESGAILEADDLEQFYKEDRILGLAELMNSYGTVRGDEAILAKIGGAFDNKKIIDGHAPGLSGRDLNAYAASGVRSDHECSSTEEAVEKLKRGQYIMIRQGTAAQNLHALIPLFDDRYCDRCLLVTDDKHPGDLIYQGHIDHIIRKAIDMGCNPYNAVKMATLNAASYFGLRDRGAIAPGYLADLIVISDLEEFKVLKVFKNGRQVASDGKLSVPIKVPDIDVNKYGRVFHSFNMKQVSSKDFEVKGTGSKKRVIQMVPGEILTQEIIVPNDKEGGVDIDNDIIKLAVIERHKGSGHIGVGFVKGYGLKKGAIASSVAHDSHNLIVAGTNDEDMALAANAVRENEGGLAIAADGQVLATLALHLGGLMCDRDVYYVEDVLIDMKITARNLGVGKDIDPFMTLAFTALPVIPKLRILTNGVVDVDDQGYVPVIFD